MNHEYYFIEWCKEHPGLRPSPFSLNQKEKRAAVWYSRNIKHAEYLIKLI